MRTAHRGVLLATGSVLTLAALATLGGCADISPEVDTLSQRPADVNNRIAITNDTNLRMLNQDLGRLFLLDRPSRLTPGPVPY
ncbi:MAG: hypothetical protein ACTS27_09255 [Phycisphaerales bacterium]